MSIGKPEGLAQSLHSCLSTPLVIPMSDVATHESSGISLAEAASFRAAEPGCGQAGVFRVPQEIAYGRDRLKSMGNPQPAGIQALRLVARGLPLPHRATFQGPAVRRGTREFIA
jgi:hypothetical protein